MVATSLQTFVQEDSVVDFNTIRDPSVLRNVVLESGTFHSFIQTMEKAVGEETLQTPLGIHVNEAKAGNFIAHLDIQNSNGNENVSVLLNHN